MRFTRMLTVLCVGGALTGMAWAADDPGMMQQQKKPDAVVVMDSAQATFTVKAVDQASRTVTLQGADGKEFKYTASDAVRRFDQIKVGDIVQASVFRQLGLFVHAPDSTPTKPEQDAIVEATKGAKPGMIVAKVDQMTVDIKAIDQDKRTVTIQGPQGKEVTLNIPQQVDISSLKTGDQVTTRLTEAVAIQTMAPDDARPAGQKMPSDQN